MKPYLITKKTLVLIIILMQTTHYVFAYRLPAVNLGYTSFLDGGPIRPHPGWYQESYLSYYNTHTFFDGQGDPLGGSFANQPTADSLVAVLQAVYQINYTILRGMPGFGIGFPICLHAHLGENSLGIVDKRKGIGDFGISTFLQFYPLFYKQRPLFVHRINLGMALATARTGTITEITMGRGYNALTPYWAATLFVTPKLALSWRLHYVWTLNTNKKTKIHPGQAVYLNFNGAYEMYHNLWIGINGYFLQQTTDSTLRNVIQLHNRERVLGIGPGAVYHFKKHFYLFGNLYFESMVRSRPQGINSVLRLVITF